jgi:small subunit ribosomal protein S17
MRGRVVSVKTKNTAVIIVERTKTHPLYKKSFLRSKRFLVEDKLGVKPGDLVEVFKIRPISKMKHWQIEKVVGRDIEEIVEAELKEKAAEIVAEVMPEKEEVNQLISESVNQEEAEAKPKKRVRKEKTS